MQSCGDRKPDMIKARIGAARDRRQHDNCFFFHLFFRLWTVTALKSALDWYYCIKKKNCRIYNLSESHTFYWFKKYIPSTSQLNKKYTYFPADSTSFRESFNHQPFTKKSYKFNIQQIWDLKKWCMLYGRVPWPQLQAEAKSGRSHLYFFSEQNELINLIHKLDLDQWSTLPHNWSPSDDAHAAADTGGLLYFVLLLLRFRVFFLLFIMYGQGFFDLFVLRWKRNLLCCCNARDDYETVFRVGKKWDLDFFCRLWMHRLTRYFYRKVKEVCY